MVHTLEGDIAFDRFVVIASIRSTPRSGSMIAPNSAAAEVEDGERDLADRPRQ
jgi:hypothetical protein